MPVVAGQVIAERYRLVRPIGKGAQASVWIAEHLALGSQVAMKVMDPELVELGDAKERFKREATAAAQLRSAHVVQILDHGIDGTQPFMVMELLDGEDLFQRLERKNRLTIAETSLIVTQIARALARAHAAGIVHRDLKPENVYLVPNEDDEIAKVLDFGVAKFLEAGAAARRTSAGTLLGTPHYMSPEQVRGVGEIDHRSDLWSLGIIAYQLATGDLPFESEGVGDLLIKITMDKVPVPSKLRPDMPKTFDDWFAKACQRDVEKRFQTAREMAEALARVAGLVQPPLDSLRGANMQVAKALSEPPAFEVDFDEVDVPRAAALPGQAAAARAKGPPPAPAQRRGTPPAAAGGAPAAATPAPPAAGGAPARPGVARPAPRPGLAPTPQPTATRTVPAARPASPAVSTGTVEVQGEDLDEAWPDEPPEAVASTPPPAAVAPKPQGRPAPRHDGPGTAAPRATSSDDVAAGPASARAKAARETEPAPPMQAQHEPPPAAPEQATTPQRPPPAAPKPTPSAAEPPPSPRAETASSSPGGPPSRPGASVSDAPPRSKSQLSSTISGASGDVLPPPELDGSRKKRAVLYVALAGIVGAGALAFAVVRSNNAPDARPAPAATSDRTAARPTPQAVEAPPVPATSASATASSSAAALDPGQSKRPVRSTPTTGPRPTGGGGRRPPPASNPDGEVVIEVPLPDREVPVPPSP